jgi:uncharacterized protein (TIGR03435 family)
MKPFMAGRPGWTAKKTLAAFAAVALMALGAVVGRAQAAAAPGMAYEVATIKLAPSGPMSMMGLMPRPDGIHAENVTVAMLVRFAYGGARFPTDDRVLGVPDWGKTDRYFMDAKMSEADIAEWAKLSKDEQDARRDLMLQALLADRFKLKTHIETKQVPVYEMVVAKGGSKLKESKPDEEVKSPTGMPMKGSFLLFGKDKLMARQYSMKGFANFLSGPMAGVGRPVMDKTGLTGTYSFELPMRMGQAPAAGGEDQVSIFTSLQDELGLKLQPATGAVDLLVVDHVEKPTEN